MKKSLVQLALNPFLHSSSKIRNPGLRFRVISDPSLSVVVLVLKGRVYSTLSFTSHKLEPITVKVAGGKVSNDWEIIIVYLPKKTIGSFLFLCGRKNVSLWREPFLKKRGLKVHLRRTSSKKWLTQSPLHNLKWAIWISKVVQNVRRNRTIQTNIELTIWIQRYSNPSSNMIFIRMI